jgi:Tfp pilus assembly protein PilO
VTRTNKILIAVVATAAALGAFWFLALAPKRDEAAKLDKDISAKQAEVSTAKTTLAGYQKARDHYKSNYATVVRLGKAVPEDDDVRSLVVQLDESARRAKIDFANIALTDVGSSQPAATPAADTSATPAFVTQPFSFAFNGSFFRLSDFFSQLDRFVQVDGEDIDVTGRLLRIETFKLTPQGSSGMLKAEIGATSYSLPDSEGVTAGATAQGPAGATAAAPGSSSAATPASGTTATTTATAGVVR